MRRHGPAPAGPVLAVYLTLALAAAANAQTPALAPAGPEFFSRYDFHLNANSLSGDDIRFSWDSHFGGDLDLVDYVKGRASILVDYEAVMGSEYRPFDPDQVYYVLETSGSYRAGPTEFAVVFHHVSRHLSDRPKPFSIAWNVLGARVLRRIEVGGLQIDGRVDFGAIVQHSYVDYSWIADADLSIRRPISPRVGVFVHGHGELFGVDGSVPNRNTQTGGMLDAGVRLSGKAGALELFAGVERRIDADPADRLPQRWGIAGFRLLSK